MGASQFDRAELFMDSLGKGDLTPKTGFQKGIVTCLRYSVRPLLIVGKKCYVVYKMLPMNYFQMIYGLGLCFFGGTFFATLAAIEAAKQFGGQASLDELALIYGQAQVAEAAS